MKGIIFSTPMVQAILQGRKTQTRRIIKPQFKQCNHAAYRFAEWKNEPSKFVIHADGRTYCTLCGNGIQFGKDYNGLLCPYKVGDVLYVKETYQHTDILNIHPTDDTYGYVYKADSQPWEDFEGWKWKSPMFMPEKAARLFIVITGIKAERLGDISEEDAIAEGIQFNPDAPAAVSNKGAFAKLWESINGKESWNANPWVWAYTFEIYQP